MSFWNQLKVGGSALTAQRLRLDIISNNIANAETTRTADGGPYQRQDVVFSPEGQPVFFPFLLKANKSLGPDSSFRPGGVKVADIVTDQSPGTRILDPEHPDADEEGYVEYPNVNLVVEMTNMMSATRSYEANLNMITASRKMAMKALEIAR